MVKRKHHEKRKTWPNLKIAVIWILNGELDMKKNRKSISSIACLFAQLTEYSGSFF